MLPASHVFPVNESHCGTGATSTTGATGSVQVVLLVLGNGVVDYVGDVVYVDTSGGNLGGNQDFLFARAECGHRALAGFLRHVTVQSGCIESAVNQFFGNFAGLTLGLAEDYGLTATLGLKNTANHFVLVE